MNAVKLTLLLGFVLLYFNGCESKSSGTQVREMHWDRDMCERCKMVVSDRHLAVQVINTRTGKAYVYDDIGCTVLWLEEEKIAVSTVKIWVTDITTGKWIDAKTAFYSTSNITPMAYGFGAHENNSSIKAGEKIIDFKEVSKRILDLEANKKGTAQ